MVLEMAGAVIDDVVGEQYSRENVDQPVVPSPTGHEVEMCSLVNPFRERTLMYQSCRDRAWHINPQRSDLIAGPEPCSQTGMRNQDTENVLHPVQSRKGFDPLRAAQSLIFHFQGLRRP